MKARLVHPICPNPLCDVLIDHPLFLHPGVPVPPPPYCRGCGKEMELAVDTIKYRYAKTKRHA